MRSHSAAAMKPRAHHEDVQAQRELRQDQRPAFRQPEPREQHLLVRLGAMAFRGQLLRGLHRAHDVEDVGGDEGHRDGDPQREVLTGDEHRQSCPRIHHDIEPCLPAHRSAIRRGGLSQRKNRAGPARWTHVAHMAKVWLPSMFVSLWNRGRGPWYVDSTSSKAGRYSPSE